MKKLLLLLVCIAGLVFSAKGQDEVLIEYNTGSAAGSTWTGKSGTSADGYTLSNASGKSVSAGIVLGDYKAIKFSNGAQYTISIPSNVSISKIKFVAYSNDAATSSYLYELNGVTYGTSDYIFPAGKGTTTGSSEITFDTALTEKITFAFKPKETAGYIVLTLAASEPTEDTTPPSLISSVPADKESDIALDLQNIELTFDEVITLDASKLSFNNDAQIGSVTVESKKVTIPVSNLKYSTNYTLTIPAGSVTDMAETPNATTEDIIINFTTKAKPASVYMVKTPLKTWAFTWSEETLSNLAADATNWSAASSTRYSNNSSMRAVTANGITVAELDGLTFKKGTADAAKDVIRIDYPADNHVLTLNGSDISVVIPNRKAGEHIVVTACGNGAEGRTITPSNATRIKGAEGLPIVMAQNEFVVIADGDVTLKQSAGLKWASIEVQNIVTATQLPDSKDLDLGGYWGKSELESLPATITSVNLKDAETDVSSVAMANPNCLIYSSKALTGSKNVIVNGEAEEIALVDGAEFNCPEAFNAQKITYTRSFPAAGVASLCLPFAVNTLPSGIAAEKYIGSEGTTVKFESVTALEANTPYIAAVEAQNDVVFEGTGEVVATKMVDVAGSSNDYTFKGVFGNIVKGAATGLYTLRADGTGFGRATENATVVPFRAYIQENGVQPNPVKMLTLGHNEGGATNVVGEMAEDVLKVYSVDGKVIVKASAPQTINVYAMNGQLVRFEYLEAGENTISDLAKGVYLIGNNKVVIR